MQIKKEEVKIAIMESGTREFLDNGFKKASLRKIVKDAGTTTGNFYNYFRNKEALFEELIIGDYNRFLYFINNHDKMNKPDFLYNLSNPSIWNQMISEVIDDIIPNFNNGLVLLLDASEGTKYEGVKDELIILMEEHFNEHLDKANNSTISKEMGKIIATQIIDGIILIVRNNKGLELQQRLIRELIMFYIIGSMGIMGEL